MLGWLNRKKKLNEEYFARAIGIRRGYEELRNRAQSAGYIFASVLLDANAMLVRSDITREQKLALFNENIVEATPSRGFDGGLSLAALQFMALIVRSEEHSGFGSLMLSAVYAEICDFGQKYRSLEEADYLPPNSVKQQKALRGAGFESLADLVSATTKSGPEAGQNSAEVNRSVANVISLIDLRLYDQNDVLWKHLAEIESAILGPIKWK